MSSQRLGKILSNWQQLPFLQKPQLLKTFTAGLNHETHLLKVGKQSIVLKIFSHSQNTAIQAQKWGHNHGVAPEVLYTDLETGFSVFDYLDAPTLSADTINASDLKSIALGLRTMHRSTHQSSSISDFEILNFCDQYLDNIVKHSPFITDIHKQMLPILELFVNDKTPWATCHNDLVAENCFVIDGRALFIDWEYSQRHNPWFDLAAIIYYLKLDAESAKLFLANYNNGWEKLFGSTIFYSSQCALLWGDVLWHLDHNGEKSWSSLAIKWQDLQYLAKKLNITLIG